ncbi:MAG TPA: ATP-binding cassette domain-containing protein [Candidatus Elarobacter sp.]|jgi:tungstate transport system ATP-binding protein
MALTSGALALRRGRFALDLPPLSATADAPLVVIGPNGSGKSTLLLALRGLLGTSTEIARDEPAAAVFATPALVRGSVARNVRLAAPQLDDAALARLLTLTGIAAKANDDARTCSSGERQRIALARALAVAPKTLFLDEALANVDAAGRVELRAAIRDYARAQRCALVVATQTYGDVAAFAGGVLILGDGAPRMFARAGAAWDDDPYLRLVRAEAG